MNREDWLNVADCAKWRSFWFISSAYAPLDPEEREAWAAKKAADDRRYMDETNTEAMARAMAETTYLRTFARNLYRFSLSQSPARMARSVAAAIADLWA